MSDSPLPLRHDDQLKALARAEGQIRGLRRMVENGAYCIDIVTQIQAVQAALASIGRKVLHKHLRHCVTDAMKGGSVQEAEEKISQVIDILKRRRDLG